MQDVLGQIDFQLPFDLQLPAGLPLGNLMWTVLIAFVLWSARRLIMRFISQRTDDAGVLYNWRKGSDYITLFLGVVLIGNLWLETGARSFATYLGLVSAGLAIALQDLIINWVGWVFIISRRPFEVGDRIQIGEHAGDVIDIRFFQFTLLEIRNWVDADQSTGRVLHIPNKLVFSEATASFTRGFAYIWNEIPVEVTFESDWQKAKALLLALAEKHGQHLSDNARQRIREASRRYMINYNNLTPTVYTRVAASGVVLTLRYLTEPRLRRDTEQALWEDILLRVAEQDDIDFAYPTQRIYYHPVEGKTLQVEPHVSLKNSAMPLQGIPSNQI